MDVSDDLAQQRLAIEAAAADGGPARFRRRGRWLFTALAFFSVIVGGVVITFGAVDGPLRVVDLAAIGVLIGVVVDVVMVFALAERRSWAHRATVAVCLVLLVTGLLRSVLRLASGTIEIPLDAIGAALVLAVRPAVFAPELPGDGRRIGLVVAAALVSTIWPLLGPVAGRGGLLAASADQVKVDVSVDCSEIAADPTQPVMVRAAWAWTGGEFLAGGSDGVVVRWLGTTDAGEDDARGLYAEDEVELEPRDAVANGSGSPAAALTDPLIAQGDGRDYSFDVDRFGLVDGHVVLALRPVSATAKHGSVEVSAWYAHRDTWLAEGGPSSCEW